MTLSFLFTESIKIHLVLGMITDVQHGTYRAVVWSQGYNRREARRNLLFSFLVCLLFSQVNTATPF